MTLLKTIFPSYFFFRLKPEKLEQDLDRHAESARMTQGRRVTLPEFAAQLGVPESESLEDLFSLFDEVGGGVGWGRDSCFSLGAILEAKERPAFAARLPSHLSFGVSSPELLKRK